MKTADSNLVPSDWRVNCPPGSKLITLTKGEVTIVDEADYPLLVKNKWYIDSIGYAARSEVVNGKKILIRMHRVIAGTTKGMITDHINTVKLDNRRINLRVCTQAQNGWNRGAKKINRTGLKGVCLETRTGRYMATITVNGKFSNLGRFDSPEEAHEAYCEAAIKHHGSFVRLE